MAERADRLRRPGLRQVGDGQYDALTRDQPAGVHMVTGFGPDEGGLPSIGELTGTGPAREPGGVTAAMMSEMGLGPAPRRHGEPLPDVSGLADELGLA